MFNLLQAAGQGNIRHQTDIPENHANSEVGADRKYVPNQRRAEVDPQVTLVGIRQQPVEKPDPPEVNEGKQSGG